MNEIRKPFEGMESINVKDNLRATGNTPQKITATAVNNKPSWKL